MPSGKETAIGSRRLLPAVYCVGRPQPTALVSTGQLLHHAGNIFVLAGLLQSHLPHPVANPHLSCGTRGKKLRARWATTLPRRPSLRLLPRPSQTSTRRPVLKPTIHPSIQNGNPSISFHLVPPSASPPLPKPPSIRHKDPRLPKAPSHFSQFRFPASQIPPRPRAHTITRLITATTTTTTTTSLHPHHSHNRRRSDRSVAMNQANP